MYFHQLPPPPGAPASASLFTSDELVGAPSPPPRRFAGRLEEPPPPGRSATSKLLVIGLLVALLVVPLWLLQGLIADREALRAQARTSVLRSAGAEQVVGGVSVVVAVPAAKDDSAATSRVTFLDVKPADLRIDGEVTTTERRRGLHRFVTYEATALRLTGTIRRPDGVAPGTTALLVLPVTDAAATSDVLVRWNGQNASVGTVPEAFGRLETAGGPLEISAAVTFPDTDAPVRFDLSLTLRGSEALRFVPSAAKTTVALRSPWADPSFQGSALPATSTVASDGFQAEWAVSRRAAPVAYPGLPSVIEALRGRLAPPPADAVSPDPYAGGDPPDAEPTYAPDEPFGVAFVQPVDAYRQTMRTAKYGLLFVLMAFGAFFFLEVFTGRFVHAVQYLLVGFAVSLFYLLLLSFAEFVPFGSAYAAAAAMVLGLVFFYTRGLFGSWTHAGAVTALMAGKYVLFYVLLQLAVYALLAGSLGLFALLAAMMYAANRIDWKALGARPAIA